MCMAWLASVKLSSRVGEIEPPSQVDSRVFESCPLSLSLSSITLFLALRVTVQMDIIAQ